MLHVPNALALDVRQLNALKAAAGNPADPRARRKSIEESARQLESLFMRELIKSMRAASMKSGLLESEAGQLGHELLDQQLALSLSGQEFGLSRAISEQLARGMGLEAEAGAPPPPAVSTLSVPVPMPVPVPSTLALAQQRRSAPVEQPATAAQTPQTPQTPQAPQAPHVPDTPAAATRPASRVLANPPAARDHPAARFVARHAAAAQQVAQESGIPAAFLLGQAGHESGWGKSRMRATDGQDAHNLFGIKAGRGWRGRVAEVSTLEYVDGVPRRIRARFRAYASHEESFRDYVRLLRSNPRYARVLASTQHAASVWAQKLQQAGYATDPRYAEKLRRAIAVAQSALA